MILKANTKESEPKSQNSDWRWWLDCTPCMSTCFTDRFQKSKWMISLSTAQYLFNTHKLSEHYKIDGELDRSLFLWIKDSDDIECFYESSIDYRLRHMHKTILI